MGKTKYIRELRDIAASVGVQLTHVEQRRSGHYLILAQKEGVTRRVSAPGTPSDHRSLDNWRCDLRRMFAHPHETEKENVEPQN